MTMGTRNSGMNEAHTGENDPETSQSADELGEPRKASIFVDEAGRCALFGSDLYGGFLEVTLLCNERKGTCKSFVPFELFATKSEHSGEASLLYVIPGCGLTVAQLRDSPIKQREHYTGKRRLYVENSRRGPLSTQQFVELLLLNKLRRGTGRSSEGCDDICPLNTPLTERSQRTPLCGDIHIDSSPQLHTNSNCEVATRLRSQARLRVAIAGCHLSSASAKMPAETKHMCLIFILSSVYSQPLDQLLD